jgi:hypothetical protein
MPFKALLDHAQAQAIVNTLENSETAVWRSICRSYSVKFSTPLHLCLDGTIAAEDILLAVFEEQLRDFNQEKDIESLIESIERIKDPSYERKKAKETDDFVKEAELEEKERLRKGEAIPHASTEKTLFDSNRPAEKPKAGGVDFSDTKDEEREGQF